MIPGCTLTPQQVETLARPFIHMADAIMDYYKDPAHEAAFQRRCAADRYPAVHCAGCDRLGIRCGSGNHHRSCVWWTVLYRRIGGWQGRPDIKGR